MRRYADSFFRYWFVAIAPIILFPLITLGVLVLRPTPVNVTARVWTDPISNKAMGYDDPSLTPAQNFANNVTQLLAVSSFDSQVARESPLYARLAATHADPHSWPATDLRSNLKAQAAGTNLVTVSYSGKDRATALQVLQAVLHLAPTEMELFNRRPLNEHVLKTVDPPSVPSNSFSKRSLLHGLGIAIFAGLLLAGGFVVLRTALDQSVRYADEVPELLGLPVLGVVPYSREFSNREGAG